MQPTFFGNSILLFEKNQENIEKNDIVLVKVDNDTIVKRITGVPGDYVCIATKPPVTYALVSKIPKHVPNSIIVFKLSEDEYFLQGDNVGVSYDSREFGMISKSQIIGQFSL